ncbi:MAG: T9SS type A sorting domain-containing protein [Bacteroidota bacterium]
MKSLFTAALLLFSTALFSQDTIRVMHYNLMYYGQVSSFCTTSNNNINDKDICLKKIILYVKPDIFTANEVAPNTSIHQHILDYCMNVDGVTYYKKGQMTNLSNTDLSNGMFYNSEKLGLISQQNIPTSVRDMNIYNFYYKAWNLAATHDTAYLTCIVVHLKAGNTSEDASERAAETNTLMYYLNSLNKKANYLLMGDFNVYTSDEQCFQNLINYTNADIRFYDPVNMLGDWSGNSFYADYHTQSTHTSSSGCPATGGMDDRFDFILESEYIKNGTDHIQYFSGSYKTIGQDGNHFNDAITDGTNNSAPDSIIDALYGMSDHLPVSLNLRVNQTVAINEYENNFSGVWFENPVNNELNISVHLFKKAKLNLYILNLLGQTVYASKTQPPDLLVNYSIPVHSFDNGIYFLKISDDQNNSATGKFFKY